MSTNRKPLRARKSAPPAPEPTANQIEEAMIAFERAKVRYRIIEFAGYQVHVVPEQFSVEDINPTLATNHRFPTEADARHWREREIIREAITAGMRAKP